MRKGEPPRTGVLVAGVLMLAVSAGGWLVARPVLAQPVAGLPSVLSRPALTVPQAAQSMMLAVTHAGDRLVAVGAGGDVLLSDDHGASWRQADAVPVSVLLTSVHFISPAEGWVSGHLGVILHTLDGGEHWLRQMDGITAARVISAAADHMSDGPLRRQAKQAADQLVADGPDKPFFDVHPGDQGEVLAVGAFGLALRSHDGGKSWQSAMADVPDPRGFHLYRIVAFGGTTFIVGEQGLFLVSSGSAQFSPITTPYDGSFFGAATSRTGAILAFGLQGKLFRSGDHGTQWMEVATGLADAITCGITLQDGRMLLGSQGGRLILSTDDGRSFHSVGKPGRTPITGMVEDRQQIVVVGPGGPLRIATQSLENGS